MKSSRPLIDQIADVLRCHVGRENVIRSSEIARELGLPKTATRTIRAEISNEDWSEREMLVVAIPGSGFFVASDIEDVNSYMALLQNLRDGLSAKIRAFRSLAGQHGIHVK